MTTATAFASLVHLCCSQREERDSKKTRRRKAKKGWGIGSKGYLQVNTQIQNHSKSSSFRILIAQLISMNVPACTCVVCAFYCTAVLQNGRGIQSLDVC